MNRETREAARASQWPDFAAYVTWLALGMLVVVNVFLRPEADALRRALGGAAAAVTISVGAVHLRLTSSEPGSSRHAGWRWWSVGVQTGAALLAVWALREQTLAVFLIIIASIAAVSGERQSALWWLVLTNFAFLGVLLLLQHPLQAAISFPLFLGFQLFAYAMSKALDSERRTRTELAGVNAELLATRRLLQESARNQERLRISRELHDVAGHRLTALKLNLRASIESESTDRERLELCHDLSGELLEDIRSVVHQLRAADEIDVPGALALLSQQHPGLAISLEIDPRLTIDGIELAEAIVRSTQEAITNAVKHGRARSIWISLLQKDDEIALRVHDDGDGGPKTPTGHGLKGMSERAELLGGALRIDPHADSGWTLTLTFPRVVSA